MKEKFVQFLKDEGVYEKFMHNFENDPDSSEEGFDGYCNSTAPYVYVSAAFMWNHTPEEWDFWSTINDRWETHLKEHESASILTDEKAVEACLKKSRHWRW